MITIKRLTCRVRAGSGRKPSISHSGARPAAPSLEFAQPEPLSPTPRQNEATDDGQTEGIEVDKALSKADPRKVADRVYELMQRELLDARNRGGAGKR